MTTAYFSHIGKEYKKQITGVSNWRGRNYYQDSTPTKELILTLVKDLQPLEVLVIKETGELIKTDNPLYIYGDQRINLITVDNQVIYNTYEGSKFVYLLTDKILNTAKNF